MRALLLLAVVGCGEAEDTATEAAGMPVIFVESGARTIDVGWSYRVHSCYLDGAAVERCQDRTADYDTQDGAISVDMGDGDGSAWLVVVP